jgi:hypothetical protein
MARMIINEKKSEPEKDEPGWLSRLESKQAILVLHYSVGW